MSNMHESGILLPSALSRDPKSHHRHHWGAILSTASFSYHDGELQAFIPFIMKMHSGKMTYFSQKTMFKEAPAPPKLHIKIFHFSSYIKVHQKWNTIESISSCEFHYKERNAQVSMESCQRDNVVMTVPILAKNSIICWKWRIGINLLKLLLSCLSVLN